MARFWPLPKLTTTKLTTQTYGVDYFLGAPIGLSRDTTPTRSIYNPQTQQFEEIPLTELQRLLRQGKIEESVTKSPHDGHPERIHRLI